MSSKTQNKDLTWNLSPLFAGDDDPKIEVVKSKAKVAAEAFVKKWQGRNDYLQDPAVLKEALDDYENWQRNFGTDSGAGYYFELRYSTDQDNPKLKAKCQLTQDFALEIINKIQFFLLRVAKIPETDQENFLNFAPLAPYRHLLERLFAEARHQLSEPEEKILNLKQNAAHSAWRRLTASFLAKEEREVLTESGVRERKGLSEIMSLIDSQQVVVRDEAAVVLNEIFVKYLEVGEAELNAILQNKKVDDDLRGFARADLARLLSDDMEPEIVDALVAAVASRFDLSGRYYALKAKLLGLSKLKYHERNVSYGKTERDYSFEESTKLVGSVLTKLDSKFGQIFERFLSQRQFDVYPKKGKVSGAFCAGEESPVHPTYILLNYTGKARDVSTLAHEVGHGINNELMKEKQNALNFGVGMATAEVASTFMEDFVLEEMAKTASEEERLVIMMQKLSDQVSTIFRQIACYRFEEELHREHRSQGYLSKEKIGQIFQKHMTSYMGEAVELSPGSENWWLYWSHIREFFYVYSYASGLLISKVMQNEVRKNPSFISKVKDFLATGLSASPKEAFLKMGIDISKPDFWKKGLVEVEKLLVETEELANKLVLR